MRLYPEIPGRRAAVLARDLVVALLLVLFAWLGLEVREAVDRLAVLGEGVRTVGENVPLVGDPVEDLGAAGEARVHRLADLLGLLVFALPAAVLLAWWLPGRIAGIRALNAAARVLEQGDSDERRRLIAMRAVFSLPYGRLLAYTRDPLGDLEARRYDPLVAAALDDVGLRPRDAS